MPVEAPSINNNHGVNSSPAHNPIPIASPVAPKKQKLPRPQNDDLMQVDSTAHKVYIYDLDAELSDSDSSADEGKLVFLPDIERHLRSTRIPPHILANSEGELAGHNQQLVLYNVPSSLTVPEEQDSVRKAIIETRARTRERQRLKREEEASTPTPVKTRGVESRDWFYNTPTQAPVTPEAFGGMNRSYENMESVDEMMDDDLDAMDLG